MLDVIKNTMLMGLGMAAMTKDTIEKMARDVADNAKLSTEKGREFVDDVMKRAEQAKADMEANVSRLVNDNLKRVDIASKSDIDALKARIDRLEQLLSQR